MDFKVSKIELVKLILNIEMTIFLKKVSDFINNEKSEFWNELSLSEQAGIKNGIEQLENDKRTSCKDALKNIF